MHIGTHATEVVRRENSGTSFAFAGDNLGCVYLYEALRVQRFPDARTAKTNVSVECAPQLRGASAKNGLETTQFKLEPLRT